MENVRAEYMRLRKQSAGYLWPIKARDALRYARGPGPQYPTPEWKDGCIHPVLNWYSFTHGPFTVKVALEYDEYADHSEIGEFGHEWKPGCKDISKDDQYHYHYHRHNSFRYFYPATEYGSLDWKLMKSILMDETIPVDQHVTVSRNGIDLAEAWLGGGLLSMDGDPDEAFGDDDARIEEALDEASDVLMELCPA
ncbi:MAG: hypothetical protein JRC86_00505 [Deltaproteobacteria bacterium]|nr:hypothetical protein [Deltaproteobacteria bacterium]